MQIAIDETLARQRHPLEAAGIAASLSAKLAAAGLAPAPINWSYDWIVQLGGDPLDACFVVLAGRIGRRAEKIGLGTPGQPMPRSSLPAEIFALYTRPRLLVDPATVPHVARLDALDPREHPVTELVTGGYQAMKAGKRAPGSRPNLFCLQVGTEMIQPDDIGIILSLDGPRALWGGGLRRKAEIAYRATPEGSLFSYRAQIFQRLTATEIQSLVAGHRFTITFP